jgi:predicted phosphodiesterase
MKSQNTNQKNILLCILISLFCFQSIFAKIIYPWRAVSKIVKRSEYFTIFYKQDNSSSIDSVILEGLYNRIHLKIIGTEHGSFEYDNYTHAKFNYKITVKVPKKTPEELYNLIVKSPAGSSISKKSVKVIKKYKKRYKIILISDPHISRQWEGTLENGHCIELEKFDNFVKVANIIGPDIVICAGDNIHQYTMFGADTSGWNGQKNYDASQKPDVDEKWNYYYEGDKNFLGLHGLNAPAFSMAGNHDYYGTDSTASQWNQYCGLRVFGFCYHKTRFLVFDNFLGSDYPNGQIDVLESFLEDKGKGSLRILIQHNNRKFDTAFLNKHNINLAFVGHTHKPGVWQIDSTSTEGTSPGSVSKSGVKNSNLGWFRIIWIDGVSYSLSPDLKYCSNSPRLPHDDQQLNLTLSYENPNDGSMNSNRAVLRNKFDIDLHSCKVRFIMQKGSYKVTGCNIEQIITNDTVSVIDVSVDINAKSVCEIRVVSVD